MAKRKPEWYFYGFQVQENYFINCLFYSFKIYLNCNLNIITLSNQVTLNLHFMLNYMIIIL